MSDTPQPQQQSVEEQLAYLQKHWFAPKPGLSREEVRQRAAIGVLAEKCQCQRPAEAARSAVKYANALVAELEKPCQG